MITVSDNIQDLANDIGVQLENLLLNHSTIYLSNLPGSGFICVSGDYAFRPLGQEGSRLQSRLIDDYQRFIDLVICLTRNQPRTSVHEVKLADRSLRFLIQQEGLTHLSSIKKAHECARQALGTLVELLDNLYDGSDGEVVCVPDTNALIYNPHIQLWSFDGISRFILLLPPTVLQELDQLKVSHRQESVREKAQSLINQIKEYRRRGRLTDGVPLVNGVSSLRSLAVEPDFGRTLPWLNATNADDRILATYVEVMRLYPRSPVLLVTRDINLQNKAEFARLPFVEPPEPASSK